MSRPNRRSNQERREQSTEQVLASALKQFVTRGYGATSIDDIAGDAGLTKGAVYFYFKGKAALLLELLAQSRALYEAIFTGMRESASPAGEQLEMFVEWAARVGVKNNELLLLPILMSLEFQDKDPAVAMSEVLPEFRGAIPFTLVIPPSGQDRKVLQGSVQMSDIDAALDEL